MKVYHTSRYIIETPDVKHSRDLLDFGKGFYITPLVEQAKKNTLNVFFSKGKRRILTNIS